MAQALVEEDRSCPEPSTPSPEQNRVFPQPAKQKAHRAIRIDGLDQQLVSPPSADSRRWTSRFWRDGSPTTFSACQQ